MDHAMLAGDVTLQVAGDQIPAYAALGQETTPRGGVVVIHHMPGFDWATKEIVRRFAWLGYDAVCPNLHHREAPGADADDAAAANRAAGGVPDERLVADVGAAREFLLAQPHANGRTAVIGYCSGGRQSVLAACSLPFDAGIDCYGAFVMDDPPAESGIARGSLRDKLADLACPLLGLFGNDDSHPSPREVGDLAAALDALGKPHDFHGFDGAGHAFFAVDRPSYRPAVAVEGWRLIDEFLSDRLSGGEG